ncbi:hypothetical protein ASZ90_016456 [hydrocarbon metagenome]|uniref:Uncharacterized protein n=1 Tax=hydrocarbon metagenome TaxID=938273 RepID=A0A0W8EUG1_9ZZZZ
MSGGVPVDWSVNWTVSGAVPVWISEENAATGAVTAGGV